MFLIKRAIKRLNFFEKLLFVVGIAVTILGFYFINQMYTGEGHISWALLQSAFLWLVLLFLIILTDSNEAIKEELSRDIKEHAKETRALKRLAEKQLKELEMIRKRKKK